MDALILLMPILGFVWVFKMREERRRVMLLASHLHQTSIERLMERITTGYNKALEAADTAQREAIWEGLQADEQQLGEQLARLADSVAREPKDTTRVCRIALPWLDKLMPQTTFALADALRLHAQGLQDVAANTAGLSLKDRAFQFLAEMLLMQHTCHWFCRSRTIASARMVARHQTAYSQVVEAVSAPTRRAYGQLVGDSA
jgi:hypothetical protein